MRRKKTSDPKLVALMDDRAKTQAAFDRWMSRLFRASNKCRKLMSKLAWSQRKIREREEELNAPPADQVVKEVQP